MAIGYISVSTSSTVTKVEERICGARTITRGQAVKRNKPMTSIYRLQNAGQVRTKVRTEVRALSSADLVSQ